MEPKETQIQTLQNESSDALVQSTLEFIYTEYMSQGPEGWLKFMQDDLGYKPDDPVKPKGPCIRDVILDVAQFKDTTVRSSHGVGKTAMDAATLLTAMTLVPELGSIQLAPTWRQVKDVLWNEIRKWYRNSKIVPIMFELAESSPRMRSRFMPETWYARGVSATQAANVEGEHNKHFFKIIDEAKAVEDGIIEASEGAETGAEEGALVWTLYSSTPSTPGGKFTLFYKSHTKQPRWARHKISAFDSSRVSKKWIQRMIDDWGLDSQIVKARVLAEFPEGGDNILITLQEAEAFLDKTVEPQGLVSLGVDVARYGHDESVISVYHGSTLVELKPFEKKNTVQVSKIVIEYMERLDARLVVIDDIGVGGGVTDQVSEHFSNKQHIFVVPFIASARTSDNTKYCNLGDEVWWLFAQALKEKRVKSLVADEVLEGELTAYRVAYSQDNRIRIVWPERKKDRVSSDSRSPDRGDATVMGWYGSTLLHGAIELDRQETKELENDDLDETIVGNLLKRQF